MSLSKHFTPNVQRSEPGSCLLQQELRGVQDKGNQASHTPESFQARNGRERQSSQGARPELPHSCTVRNCGTPLIFCGAMQPRKGCFEVRDSSGKLFVSLLVRTQCLMCPFLA